MSTHSLRTQTHSCISLRPCALRCDVLGCAVQQLENELEEGGWKKQDENWEDERIKDKEERRKEAKKTEKGERS